MMIIKSVRSVSERRRKISTHPRIVILIMRGWEFECWQWKSEWVWWSGEWEYSCRWRKIVVVMRLENDEGRGNDFYEDRKCSAVFCSDILYRIWAEFGPNCEIRKLRIDKILRPQVKKKVWLSQHSLLCKSQSHSKFCRHLLYRKCSTSDVESVMGGKISLCS